MLDGVGIVTGTIMAPVVKSQAGKSFLAMVPGEIILASLDAVSKYFLIKLITHMTYTCRLIKEIKY